MTTSSDHPVMSEHTRPLTHVEQLIWTGQRMAGRAPIYNMALAISLKRIDPKQFARAYQRLADNFAPLRTRVHNGPDGPLLDLGAARRQSLVFVDLRNENSPHDAAQSWMQREVTEPFAFEDSLCRGALICIGDSQYTWFINQHHLITDAWSCTLLLEAIDRAYHGDLDVELETTMGHSLETHNITQLRLENARSHWQQVYRSVPQQDAIFGRLNPDRASTSDRFTYHLEAGDVSQLQAIASRKFPALSKQMSLFIAFSALLVALVSRISQRRRIGFEAPFANRATRRDQRTPGLFIELFPLAADLDGSTTFLDLGKQIQQQLTTALKYSLPGSSVPTENNGCDAVLNFIPFGLGTFGGEPVRAQYVHSGAHDAAHVLRLQVWDLRNDGGLTIMLDLNRAVITEENQSTVVDYFKSLLTAFVEETRMPVASIPLLSNAHRSQVVDRFNDISSGSLPSRPIIEAIFEQANRAPSALALEYRGEQLSYAELTAKVESVAEALLRLGVSPGDRICLSATRSMGLVETILGIMRLGATYVPVDPKYPASRRNAIYGSVNPQIVVSDDPAGDSAAPDHLRQVTISAVTKDEPDREASAHRLPDCSQLKLNDLAYILFTSGSTGTPKGVPVSQEGLAVYLQWALSVYADENPVTMPLFTSTAFDLTVTSMFLPLLCGGSVVVYSPTSESFDDSLFRAIEEDKVDTVKLTPSHLRLLRRLDLHRSGIRNLIVGGEQLTIELAESIDRQFSDVRIFNEYGPTEAVVGCMIHQFVRKTADSDNTNQVSRITGSTAVPIGKPAHNTRVYLLNESRQPVHPDVTGELYIQRFGAPVAYLDDADTTEQAFFPDLVSPQKTMYRTGDLARFKRHGELVFLGRIDQQVKVAGHRVETEEIESALLRVANIDACSVLLDLRSESSSNAMARCSTCGIGDDTPGIKLDEEGSCNLCRDFAVHASRIDAYFRSRDELKEVIAATARRKAGQYDCMALLSGGKDSTFALYQIVGMGFNVYAFTLDNGYMSPQARDNVQRVVGDLGVDHEFASTERMPEIFRDSLSRFSNVCQGCFKTIYTLSLRRAAELGIPAVITGLSRGQLFETRLNLGLFRGTRRDNEIDQAVLQARKAYHRRSDAVTRCLGNEEFKADAIFQRVELIDFYRYWSASLTEMLEFLQEKASWIRPSDTGRSSNCLINDVGIHVHRSERGFHNYALPYSWDVRLGQKERNQAVHELEDDIDETRVAKILQDIGYHPAQDQDRRTEQLVAFYTARVPTDPEQLRCALAAIMPSWSVPHRFIQVEDIPLTINGKVDRRALLARLSASPSSRSFRAPETDAEEVIVELWSELLPITEVGADDNFFELGGTSIGAIEFTTRLSDQFSVDLPLELIFTKPVLSEIAAELEAALIAEIETFSDAEVDAALHEESTLS